jgi:hypothetical protein
LTAERTPSGTPTTVAMSRARMTSSSVTVSASKTMFETGSAFRSEKPKSPCTTPLIQRQYCSA